MVMVVAAVLLVVVVAVAVVLVWYVWCGEACWHCVGVTGTGD